MKLTDFQDQLESNNLEGQLIALGKVFPYPPTPSLSAALAVKSTHPIALLRRPRLMLFLALVVIGLFVISIPPVRAAVVEFLQFGRIRIYLNSDQTPVTGTAEPLGLVPGSIPSGTNTPGEISEDIVDSIRITGFSSLGGEKTVAGARAEFPYPSPLPHYPGNLGLPDHAYLQDLGGPVVVFVWESPDIENEVMLSLIILAPNTFASKGAPQVITETMVNGRRALWLEGEHHLILEVAGEIQPLNLTVGGNVLIWDDGGLTYRLEGIYPLGEMVRIAESLE